MTSYEGGPSADDAGGVITFTSSAILSARGGALGVDFKGSATGGFPGGHTAGGEAYVSWDDDISLVWHDLEFPPPLPYSNVLVSFSLVALLEASVGETSNFQAYLHSAVQLDAGFQAGLGTTISNSFSLDSNDAADPTSNLLGVADVVTGIVQLQTDATTHISWFLRGRADASFGAGEVDALHTLKLTSVTFPDGTTPESRGWDVVFATGIPSPNLATVPESSSILLFSTGGLVCLAFLGLRSKLRHVS